MLGLFFPIYGEKMFQTTNQVKSSVSPLHMVTTPPVPRLPNRADSGTNAPVACAKPRGSGCKARMNKGWLYSKWVENYVFLFFRVSFFSEHTRCIQDLHIFLSLSFMMRVSSHFHNNEVSFVVSGYYCMYIYIEKSQHMCIPAPLGGRLKCLPNLA